MIFIGSFINLSLLGQMINLIKYSMEKKTTTKLSIISITKTTIGYAMMPSTSSCNSSAVEMMKVTVEMRTMERENKARNWAKLLVHGYYCVP